MKNILPLLCMVLLLAGSCTNKKIKPNGLTVLKGATILDGNGNRIENGVLLIEEGIITAVENSIDVPDGAQLVDLTGKYVTPGLVDAHVHFAQTGFVDGRPDALDIRDSINYIELQARLQLHPEPYYEAYLRSGVTAVYDVGGAPWSISMQRLAENDVLAPHVAAAGPLLTPVAQENLETFNTPSQKQMLELRSPEFGKEVVIGNSETGSTGIKIWQINLEDPEFMASLKAVAEETRARGNKLIVHATTLDQAKEALRLGAKVLVHSVEDKEVDDEFLNLARKQDVIYIPTIVVLGGYYNTYKAVLDGGFEINDPNGVVDDHTRALMEGAQSFAPLIDTNLLRQRLPRMETYIRNSDSIMMLNLSKIYKAGIRIAPGTDAGNPGTLHGISIYDELEAIQKAGIPADELLVMTCRNGAAAMERSADLGTLEPGKKADLLVMDKDPAEDIANLRTLTHVMRGGQMRKVSEDFKVNTKP